MERLKIEEAIIQTSAKWGRRITQNEVGEILFPASSRAAQQINFSKLMNGKTKRVDIQMIRRLCEYLEVDANFLFDVKPVKK